MYPIPNTPGKIRERETRRLHDCIDNEARVAEIKSCLDAGADPYTKTPESAIYRAVHKRKPLALAELLELGVREENSKSYGGAERAILLAIRTEDTDSLSLLLKNKASINALVDGLPLLSCALSYPKSLRLILEAGADPDQADVAGLTPLMQACRLDKGDTILTLLDAGANPNLRSRENLTALNFLKPTIDNMPSLSRLLKAGADPNGGLTTCPPLTLAINHQNIAAIECLLAHGADPLHQPVTGTLMPLAAARSRNSEEIILIVDSAVKNALAQRNTDQQAWKKTGPQEVTHCRLAGPCQITHVFNFAAREIHEIVAHIHNSGLDTHRHSFEGFRDKNLLDQAASFLTANGGHIDGRAKRPLRPGPDKP